MNRKDSVKTQPIPAITPIPSATLFGEPRAGAVRVRLLLVDDDREMCRMLAAYLATEGFDAASVHDGHQGVVAAASGAYDAVVLDIMMPALDGMGALREIRKRSDVPVIMLTARGDSMDRVVGLESGADDYVSKPYDPRELVARLRAVLRRRSQEDRQAVPRRLAINRLELCARTRKVHCAGEPVALTASEFNVLEALMCAGGAVRSKEELTLAALGKKRDAYDRSLDVHVSNIRQKLQRTAGNDAQIETVRGVGYRISAGH